MAKSMDESMDESDYGTVTAEILIVIFFFFFFLNTSMPFGLAVFFGSLIATVFPACLVHGARTVRICLIFSSSSEQYNKN